MLPDAKISGCSARLHEQFYCRKAGDDFYLAIFLPNTQNYVYRSQYICCVWATNIECAMSMFGPSYNVLSNNIKYRV